MANKSDSNPAEAAGEFKYFKSKLLGLNTLDQTDPDNVVSVRFEPRAFYHEETETSYKMGYLRTDNEHAIKVFSNDINVKEIQQDEYEKAMEEGTPASY